MPENKENMHHCNFHKFEKNKYFYGKLMTVRDFEEEQKYFDGKRYLINRLLHGTGIVCGFNELELIKNKDEVFKISFKDGGMALDCCGHEIIVPPGTMEKEIVSEDGGQYSSNSVPSRFYLYLRYKTFYGSYLAVASNSSICEEKCCPGRIIEDFEVVLSPQAPDFADIPCRKDLPSEPVNNEEAVKKWLNTLETNNWSRPPCRDERSKVFLAYFKHENDETFSIDIVITEKYRPDIFRNEDLYKIFKCHILDSNNPHAVTASQVKALESINGVRRDWKGNIELIKNGSIVINPSENGNTIIIGETHSADKDNPHEVTAEQVKALVSIDGVGRDSIGNINLVRDGSIVINSEPGKNSITIGETHSQRMDNPHNVTADVIGALVSVNGISNHGGNIDIVEGTNIKITPDGNSIKFDCTLRSEIKLSDTVINSIGPENLIGTSTMYARADHVHMLEDNSVDYSKLSAGLQEQLSILSIYLREKALKYSVTSFKKVAKDFKNDRAREISSTFKEGIGNKVYEKEDDFIKFIDSKQSLIKEFAEEIRELAEEEGLIEFEDSLETLQKLIREGSSFKVAAQQDEVCFYALELKRNINYLIFKAMNCTIVNFRKVNETFGRNIAENILSNFEKAIEDRVYENDNVFIEFMRENFELLNTLQNEIEDSATRESRNNYISAVNKLGEIIETNEALEISAKLEDVCFFAGRLQLNTRELMHTALVCTSENYKKVAKIFENETANKISSNFGNAINQKLYENKDYFIDFIKKNLKLLTAFQEEIKDNTIESDFDNYRKELEGLTDAIKSNKGAFYVAGKLKVLCHFVDKLTPVIMYRALNCNAVNFKEFSEKYDNSKAAKEISNIFGKAVADRKYDYDDEYIDFIKQYFELFRTFLEEIKETCVVNVDRDSELNYDRALRSLEDAIESREVVEVAIRLEEVCSSAKELIESSSPDA